MRPVYCRNNLLLSDYQYLITAFNMESFSATSLSKVSCNCSREKMSVTNFSGTIRPDAINWMVSSNSCRVQETLPRKRNFMKYSLIHRKRDFIIYRVADHYDFTAWFYYSYLHRFAAQNQSLQPQKPHQNRPASSPTFFLLHLDRSHQKSYRNLRIPLPSEF